MTDKPWHEVVFENDGIFFNNAPFPRDCIRCEFKIPAKSVHQERRNMCIPVKIHVHRYYKNTGNCYISGCIDKISLDYINELSFEGRQQMLVRPFDLDNLGTK